MKVFISSSGARSKALAETLQQWLPLVIQASEPWLSSEMTKGIRWSPEISSKLEESRIGVICLTPENLTAPWILFEAGAISKTKDASVCTFLLDVSAADVEPPLGQFQHTLPNKVDMQRLVRDINSAAAAGGEKAVTEKALEETFLAFWPRLETRLGEISAAGKPKHSAVRTERQLIEEVLEIVRGMDRRFSTGSVGSFRAAELPDLIAEDLLARRNLGLPALKEPFPGPTFTKLDPGEVGLLSEVLKRADKAVKTGKKP